MANAAAPLVNWLAQRPQTQSALDYGCGKLRYTSHLAANSPDLGIADSKEQLDRTQIIDGEQTTVREYAEEAWQGCHIYDLGSFWQGIEEAYDFILCANVLSAIPSAAVRARTLRSLRAAMSQHAKLLVVNQHTNSYFTQAKASPKATPHLDGWVMSSQKGASYYGVLTKAKTVGLLQRYGFAIQCAWVDGQSNYVLADGGVR
jgi:hypothetical protein